MNFRYLKILLVALGLVFISQGCFVPPPYPYRHHHHRHYRHGHSSLQQSDQSGVYRTAQINGDSGMGDSGMHDEVSSEGQVTTIP
jgi:hypothetical protein